jgi:hypothetical protein
MAQQGIGLDNKRLVWLLISAVFMFASAYSVFRCLGAVGTISGWTGLPQHDAQIPRLRVQAGLWEALALTLPFLAAVFVWTGRQKPFNRNDTAAFVFECGVCLAASILGTLGFLLCLFTLGMLLYKLGW